MFIDMHTQTNLEFSHKQCSPSFWLSRIFLIVTSHGTLGLITKFQCCQMNSFYKEDQLKWILEDIEKIDETEELRMGMADF